MARLPRLDCEGAWHHVMNRGIARRPVFEGRSDIRFFLSRVARAVRRGELEVHAYCILATHFHMLVRSPAAQLSQALRSIQLDYVRRFNRSRRRDGPLLRGRFLSRRVDTLEYRRVLVAYIDANPVAAKVVARSAHYEYGSARAYVFGRSPPWLERSWVEADMGIRRGPFDRDDGLYEALFSGETRPGRLTIVERRLGGASAAVDPLDDLVRAAPPAVRAWMRRKARLADGTRPGVAVVDPTSVESALDCCSQRPREWSVLHGSRRWDARELARIALLRDLAGLSYAEIGSYSGQATATVRHHYGVHAELVESDERYAETITIAAREALLRCHGAAARVGE